MKLLLRLIGESFLFAWQALVVNKLRTLLSLLGVTIGIFSIIFVLSVVDSMEADMKESLESIGSDVLFIQKWPMGPEGGAEEYEWWKFMRRRQPSVDDMEKLRDRITGESAIAYQASSQGTAERGNNYLENSRIIGITFEYNRTIALEVGSGRYFTQPECDGGKNVAVIGHSVADQLFPGESAVGREMKIGGLRVTVIGVLEKEGASLFGGGQDNAVFLPMDFAVRLLDPDRQDANIILRAREGVSSRELKDEVMGSFREVRGIKPTGENDFSIIESSMISGMVDSVVGVFNVVGMIIGVFAILVGAFSIANIMFVSVRERTNIIGIQKALGAKNYFILLQFLFESVALSMIGGAAGLVFVFAVMNVLNLNMDLQFILPFKRVLMGMGISGVVGVISGIVPALSAARMNPVEAMRSK